MDQTKSAGQVMKQIGDFAKGLSTRQKIMLGVGAVLVASTLAVFVHLIGNPEYTTLYSGMSGTDAQSLGSRLAAKNIPYRISQDGSSISVPADKLDAARLETASQNLPQSGKLGFELFDKPNWAADDFSEKVNYQRALEGELERTLATLNEVESARVHLVLPHDSLFVEDQSEAKAAVIVRTKGGRYAPETQQAIQRLVASAVDRLRPENVTVIDAETNRPFDLGQGDTDTPGNGGLEQRLAKKLVDTLGPVVGAQSVRASVRVEYDPTSTEENSEEYDPDSAVAITMQKSEERNGGTGVSGVPGTASNVPGAKPGRTAARTEQNTQSSTSENGTYAVNKVVRHTVTPAGRVKRIAAALLVDDAIDVVQQGNNKVKSRRRRSADEMRQIEELARAAIGLDTTRGDTISVQNLSFQGSLYDEPPEPTLWEKIQRFLENWAGVLRYFGIAALFAAVYLLILRPVKKQAISAFRNPGKPAPALKAKPAPPPPVIEAKEVSPLEAQDESPESKRASVLKRRLLDKVKAEPAGASRLIQSWIHEDRAE